MSETVFIKATVRNPALLDNSLLVFKTLHIGFPVNDIVVCTESPEVEKAALFEGCDVIRGPLGQTHDEWILARIGCGHAPFWICDTDMIFHAPIVWTGDAALAGPLEPEHWSPYTQAYHTERLHTCLMRIDPARLREQLDTFWQLRPGTPWTARHELVRQAWAPGRPLRFHDTMSRVYQAVGGTPFPSSVLDCFSHLHAGTFTDLLAKEYPDMARAHAHFREHPEQSRGLWKRQLAAQAAQRPKPGLGGDPLLNHKP